MSERGFETTVRSGVLRIGRPDTEWLSTGFDGGRWRADAAYNLTVPEGWAETDLRTYVDRRLAEAGFEAAGPALLTGVEMRHARRAQLDSVTAIVTAGLSNPSTLPLDPDATCGETPSDDRSTAYHPGTINVVAGTTASLSPGALANLATVVTEAKTATLQQLTGFSGTTSDAVIVGSDPGGTETTFSGAATAVGRATRACVRDALVSAIDARYEAAAIPRSVDDAAYGVETDVRSAVTKVRFDDS
ncbi:MAG: adenosylcobinamide amidohydrolase [Halobacteriota archaeon]